MPGASVPLGRLLPALWALLPALLLAGCGSLEGSRSCGTEIPEEPEEVLAGCIVDDEGRPVSDVAVVAVPAREATHKRSSDPSGSGVEPGIVSLTDKDGRYGFMRLEPGTYYIMALDTAGEDLHRSMPTETLTVKEYSRFFLRDTLFRHGTLTGTIRLADQAPVAGVVCDILDRPFAVKSDSTGRFSMSIPAGQYLLRCQHGETLVPAQMKVTVVSDSTIHVPLSMAVKEETKVRPPPPAEATAVYDSVTGAVHLKWSRVVFNQPFVYWVKRIDRTMPQPDPNFTTLDTFYSDVIYRPESGTDRSGSGPKSLIYNIGTSFDYTYSLNPLKLIVEVSPPVFLGPAVTVKAAAGAAECAVGDTLLLAGEFGNPFRANRKLDWSREEPGADLRTLSVSARSGVDTLAYPCVAAGSPRVRFKVTDESGASASAMLSLTIRP